jgi:YcxB-like protein
MKIRYELTIDDVVTFNRYHAIRSPTGRRMTTQRRWVMSLGMLTLGAMLSAVMRDVVYAVILTAAAVASIFLIPFEVRRTVDRQARRFFEENKKRLGDYCELELLERDLVYRGATIESRMNLIEVDRVVEDGDLVYIYLTSNNAHVVPRHQIREGDVDAFLTELEQRRSEVRQEVVAGEPPSA